MSRTDPQLNLSSLSTVVGTDSSVTQERQYERRAVTRIAGSCPSTVGKWSVHQIMLEQWRCLLTS